MLLAFTLIEAIAVVVIVGGLFSLAVYFYRRATHVSITGTWTTAPPTVSQSPASATFVFTMTKTIGRGTPAPVASREIIIAVAPTTDVRIVNITDESGTTPYPASANKITATTATDASGNVSVTIQTDHLGAASITAIDQKSGLSEVQDWRGVP